MPANRLRETLWEHDEVRAFAQRVAAVFEGWHAAHEAALRRIKVDDLPRELIHTLSEDLLARFGDLPLLSRYDVYQRLMDYWAEVMQDDVYLIAADGWLEAVRPRGIVEDKDKKIKEMPDLTIGRKKYKMDLVPPALVVARFFTAEQAALDALQAKQDAAALELEDFVEEHGGEEGLLAEALNDKGRVTKGGVKERLKGLEDEPESDDEREALECCLALIEAETEAAKAVKEAQRRLDEKVLARYGKLTEAEIKRLAVEDKWLGSVRSAVDDEVQALIQHLGRRVGELEVRYSQPLPVLEREVEAISTKVDGHLMQMGLAWG